MTKHRWKPLQRANYIVSIEESAIAYCTEKGMTRAEAIERLEAEARDTEYFVNDLYQVAVHRFMTGFGKTLHLNIRRRDGKPIFRDWRHFQTIKNELAGEEIEAIELYPAESRLVDTSNKYHLWCFMEPGYRIPLGFEKRDVIANDAAKEPGFRQRRIETA